MASIAAVLDANVLVPAVLCDFLLRAASAGMYRLLWSEDILAEVERTLVNDLHKTQEQANRRITVMREAFPEALVTQHAPLIPAMTNDPKDRHVLAAAIVSGAQIIVTSNLADFPPDALAPYFMDAQAPDQFLLQLLGQDQALVTQILRRQASALRNPPKTADDTLDELSRFAPTFITHYRS